MGLGGMAMLGATAGTARAAKQHPNILLLMADQHRADCVGADGNRVIRTPHLDRLAKEGVLFRRAYSSVPSCTPARAGLLTGLSPWHHGMLGYGRVALRYRNELPLLLREQGYQTLGVGKMHWSPQRTLHGFHRTVLDESGRAETPGFVSDYRQWFQQAAPGLDPDATGLGWNDHRAKPYALPEHVHPTRWTGDVACDFLASYRGDEPWFLKVSFARPHSPYDPPERFWKLYADADLPKAAVGDWAERHAQRGKPYPNDLWRGDLGPEEVRSARQGYYGSVTFIDEQVGRVLDMVAKRGWLENTLILFTSDHGDMTGDHHLWRKTYAYEASARVPMLVRWGGEFLDAKRGQVCDKPVELRDVLPTFLDAAGASFDPARFDGRSLLDLVRGKGDAWRTLLDLEHAACYVPTSHWTAVTDGHAKYIYHAFDGEEQLFDLDRDPAELHDLARDPSQAATVRAWRRRMVEQLAERGAPFVGGGDLAPRPKSTLLSPHYPREEKKG
jgi:arylsulfatase A-like enzyme